MATQIHYILEMMTVNDTPEALGSLWIIAVE